jgi:DNA-binding transcriptional ArsR family regulator
MANKRIDYSLLPFTFVAKAVADEKRIRILAALREHELCVCQMVELLGLAPSTVSKHLSILRQAYLVDMRKDGRWTYYSRPKTDLMPAARAALQWIDQSLVGDSVLSDDARRLDRILEVPLEKICKTPRAS